MAEIKIALAGNPNSGKTTLFNALTGGNQYVGNWPGVTVEKKDGRLRKHEDVIIQDLPGIYSLSPYSLEEVVARSYLVDEAPDAIINIVDGTNIERNLYLTTQLLELGIPTVIAINMMDVVRRNGDSIDLDKLSREIRCPIVAISALKNEGLVEAAEMAIELAVKGKASSRPHVFTGSVEHAIAHIEESIQGKVPESKLRWYAIKVFERDQKVYESLNLDDELISHLNEHVKDCEVEMDDDAESIITDQRYRRVGELVSMCVKKRARKGSLSLSDKIDKIVTNRILALPIFALVIWFMYFVAVSTIGGWLTDWANDGLFGDGWFVYKTTDKSAFCSDEVNAKRALNPDYTWETLSTDFDNASRIVENWEQAYIDSYSSSNGGLMPKRDDDGALIVDESFAKSVKAHIVFDDELSGVIDTEASRDYGYGDYLDALKVEEPEPADFGLWVPGLPPMTEALFEKLGISDDSWVYTLVFEVIFMGVGTILGFVPQIIIVFLFLAFLEDCGYMARIAFIMDKIFRRFGLSGKSFIPMIVGMGCGVPAILATRTIESQRDRRMTVMLATYIPCSAKYAIIAMFTTAFFNGNAMVATLMYLLGVVTIALGGIILKKFGVFAGEAAPFVMELPAYHMPTAKGIIIHTWDRTKEYIVKAGTIIFIACVSIWVLMSFDWTFNMVDLEESMLHDIGTLTAWLFTPLGFGDWKGAVASFMALIAKEQAVADLVMFAENSSEVGVAVALQGLFDSFNPGMGVATLAGLSFMILNLFDPPCLVAIATTFREMGSAKWGWIAVGFQFLTGYSLALITFQLGKVIFCGCPFTVGTAFAIAILAVIVILLFRKTPEVKK